MQTSLKPSRFICQRFYPIYLSIYTRKIPMVKYGNMHKHTRSKTHMHIYMHICQEGKINRWTATRVLCGMLSFNPPKPRPPNHRDTFPIISFNSYPQDQSIPLDFILDHIRTRGKPASQSFPQPLVCTWARSCGESSVVFCVTAAARAWPGRAASWMGWKLIQTLIRKNAG